jgi:hypothetical protein
VPLRSRGETSSLWTFGGSTSSATLRVTSPHRTACYAYILVVALAIFVLTGSVHELQTYLQRAFLYRIGSTSHHPINLLATRIRTIGTRKPTAHTHPVEDA